MGYIVTGLSIYSLAITVILFRVVSWRWMLSTFKSTMQSIWGRDWSQMPFDWIIEKRSQRIARVVKRQVEETETFPIFHPDQGGVWLDINPFYEAEHPVSIPSEEAQ